MQQSVWVPCDHAPEDHIVHLAAKLGIMGVSSDCPVIDGLLAGQGLQPGRLTELVGFPGVGKTALT